MFGGVKLISPSAIELEEGDVLTLDMVLEFLDVILARVF